MIPFSLGRNDILVAHEKYGVAVGLAFPFGDEVTVDVVDFEFRENERKQLGEPFVISLELFKVKIISVGDGFHLYHFAQFFGVHAAAFFVDLWQNSRFCLRRFKSRRPYHRNQQEKNYHRRDNKKIFHVITLPFRLRIRYRAPMQSGGAERVKSGGESGSHPLLVYVDFITKFWECQRRETHKTRTQAVISCVQVK